MIKALKKTTSYKVFCEALIKSNPITVAVLGICSALAVTTQLIPSLVMALSMTFVLASSNVIISFMRNIIPKNIRIIVYLTVISSLVILTDQFLKAYMYDVSKMLSVFVGLIITNCIIMGRAEAFAVGNNPWHSLWDGIGNGFGYGYILVVIGFFRELLGAGSLFGIKVIPEAFYEIGYNDMGMMVLAPGVFITIGLFVWVQNLIINKNEGAN